jgi:hypothetical protein
MTADTQHTGAPAWDEERARWLVNRTVIVGVTHLAADGKTVVNREHFHGMILSAVEGQGINVVCLSGPNEGQTVTLPPVTSAYMDAKPGTYTMRSTGLAVENPDVTVSWTVTQQPKH